MKLLNVFVSRKTEEMIRLLYPKGEADRKIRKFKKEKAVMFTAVITVTFLIFLPLFLYDLAYSGEPVESLIRRCAGRDR